MVVGSVNAFEVSFGTILSDELLRRFFFRNKKLLWALSHFLSVSLSCYGCVVSQVVRSLASRLCMVYDQCLNIILSFADELDLFNYFLLLQFLNGKGELY